MKPQSSGPIRSGKPARAPTVREIVKDWASVAQSSAAVIAIAGGAIWFYSQGESMPKVNVELQAQHVPLSQESTLLLVMVKANNVGKIPVTLAQGGLQIRQVSPLKTKLTELPVQKSKAGDLHVFDWPMLARMDLPYAMSLAPAERDFYVFENLIPATVRTVRIYAEVKDPTRSGAKWAIVALHNMDATP